MVLQHCGTDGADCPRANGGARADPRQLAQIARELVRLMATLPLAELLSGAWLGVQAVTKSARATATSLRNFMGQVFPETPMA